MSLKVKDGDMCLFVRCRSSRFARLQHIQCSIAGKNLYIRFCCTTGDAMGMNMVSKGVQNVLDFLQNDFPDMDVIGISGMFLVIYLKSCSYILLSVTNEIWLCLLVSSCMS